MRLAVFPPSPLLAAWVEDFWVFELDPGAAPLVVLPSTSSFACFVFGAAIEADGPEAARGSAFSGLQTRPFELRPVGGLGAVVVRFAPWGAGAFVRAPLDAFVDRRIELEVLFAPSAVAELEDRLAETTDDAVRIALVEGFLLRALHVPAPPPALVQLLREVGARGGTEPVHHLARRHGLSERQLERRLGAALGLGPKRFARIVRLQAALAHAEAPWVEIASDCGYTDQAHLIRDFRHLLGLTPEAWRRHAPSAAAQRFNRVPGTSVFSNTVFL